MKGFGSIPVSDRLTGFRIRLNLLEPPLDEFLFIFPKRISPLFELRLDLLVLDLTLVFFISNAPTFGRFGDYFYVLALAPLLGLYCFASDSKSPPSVVCLGVITSSVILSKSLLTPSTNSVLMTLPTLFGSTTTLAYIYFSGLSAFLFWPV